MRRLLLAPVTARPLLLAACAEPAPTTSEEPTSGTPTVAPANIGTDGGPLAGRCTPVVGRVSARLAR